MHDIYIDDHAYDQLVAGVAHGSWRGVALALAAAGVEARPDLVVALVAAVLDPCPVTGGVDRDAIMRTLGEAGDVWPESILPDVTRAHVDHLRRADRSSLAA